jgi:TonB family protein
VLAQIRVQEGQTVPVNTVVAVIAVSVVGGIPGGVPGGVLGGVPGGVPGEIPGGVVGVVTKFGWEVQGKLLEMLDQAPESPIEFKNSAKAPLAITDAKVRQLPSERGEPGDMYAVVPVVTLANNTDRRIKGFTLEFRKGLERRAYYERVPSLIDARGVYASGRQNRFVVLVGGANGWSLRVAGVLFEDGDAWGVVPPPPPPPPPPPLPQSPDSPKLIRKSGGVLSASAIKRVGPEYPPLAKAANVSGTVVVEITVDETGDVISARAISGHPLLKDAAVDAARQWKFSPTTLAGEAIKVVGTLTFNFAL